MIKRKKISRFKTFYKKFNLITYRYIASVEAPIYTILFSLLTILTLVTYTKCSCFSGFEIKCCFITFFFNLPIVQHKTDEVLV